MKTLITAFVLLTSIIAMADIPRPNPRPTPEPGPAKSVDAEALNVLVFGAPAAKLTALKTGGNTIEVTVQNLAPKVTRYTYTSRQCTYGIAGNMCLENKQMTVTKTVKVIPDHMSVTYQVSDVVKLR